MARQAAPVEEFIEKLVIARLSRPDAADLVAVPEGGPDVAMLRQEAAVIRANLDQMAADRALGLITRAQLIGATGHGTARLDQIAGQLTEAARENVLAPLIATGNAATAWAALDLARQRAIITTLMRITIYSPGRGARRGFDPATVHITWQQPPGDHDKETLTGAS